MSISTIADAQLRSSFTRASGTRPRERVSPKNIESVAARHADLQAPAAASPSAPSRMRARIGIGRRRRRPSTASAAKASSTVSAKIETQSSERQAGTTPGGRDQAEARLQADDVVEPGRHAAGAGGVGAERERHEAGGHRDRRAGARAAGDERRVERIARHAIGRAHADQAGGELVEIGLADDDGAGRAQPRDRGRVRASADRRRPGRRRWSASPATSMLSLTATGTP